ncbi:HDIG domain-containing protein [Candidatus Woesearchaeota archaeon]|nr:HDIG domain-containing protein [Candidatus Woesearchaeota archaeon]
MGWEEALAIVKKHYEEGSESYEALVTHGRMVRDKALAIAKRVPELKPDVELIEEASLLHDIGIKFTHAPDIGCHGEARYITHIALGKELLEKEGLPKHARIAESHLGVGISKEEIEAKNLPFPKKDMIPETVEEEIVSLADKFFTKVPEEMNRERSKDEVRKGLRRHGESKVKVFDEWCKKYKE